MSLGLSPSLPQPAAHTAGTPFAGTNKPADNNSPGTGGAAKALATGNMSIARLGMPAMTVTVSVGSGEKAHLAKQGCEKQKGFFAQIVGKIMDFFAGLFGISKPAKSEALALPPSSHEQQVHSQAVHAPTPLPPPPLESKSTPELPTAAASPAKPAQTSASQTESTMAPAQLATPASQSLPDSGPQLSIPAKLANDMNFLAAFEELVRKHMEPAAQQMAGSVPMAPPMGIPNAPAMGVPNAPPMGIPNAPPLGIPNVPAMGAPDAPPMAPPMAPKTSAASPRDQLLAEIQARKELKSAQPSAASAAGAANPQDALLAEIRAGAKLRSGTPSSARPAIAANPQEELFKAIRSGAKLKPASERTAAPQKPGAPTQPPTLMDQMKAAMAKRNAAMGKRDNE